MIGRTVLDNRSGRRNHWVLLPEGVKHLMQVPDDMRKCVVFLYATVKGKMLPAGTAFFLFAAVPRHEGRTVALLFTADHVIDGIRQKSDDRKVTIRMNAQDGGTVTHTTSVDDWIHPDPHVDCAMLPWVPPPEMGVDFAGWLIEDGIATAHVRTAEGIGIGDEVFMVGLFRNHMGQDRNEPILRVGNIAALPADPIQTKGYGPMHALLIETRSIGGLSGSPVFVHLGPIRMQDSQITANPTERPFFFLGLMHGHWDAFEVEADAHLLDPGLEKVNMGIGIVVPADEIFRLFGRTLNGLAQISAERLDAEQEPTEDDALAADSGEFERFEELTDKLLRVPKKELDDKLAES